MANYLLPCRCGQSVAVSTSMAGESVRCACGAELQVPTLRGLRQLAQADKGGIDQAPRTRGWTDRNRATFVLVVAALLSCLVAADLALRMPPEPTVQVVRTGPLIGESTPPAHVYAVFDELQKGIRPRTNVITGEAKEAMEQRRAMTWGIRFALGVGACTLVAAVVSVLVPGRRR
jgi:hypothetical protein